MEPQLISNYIAAEKWMIPIILVGLSLLAIVRYNYRKINSLYFTAIISTALPSNFIQKEKVLTHRAALLLLVSAGIFTALLITVLGHKFSPTLIYDTNIGLFLLIFLFLVIFYILKIILHTAFVIILDEDYGIEEYVLNCSFINMLTGVVLIPVVLGVLFMSSTYHGFFLNLSLGIIIAMQLFKIFKGSLIAFRYKVNLLYFIMYLCCFEIVPILVLVKEVFFKV